VEQVALNRHDLFQYRNAIIELVVTVSRKVMLKSENSVIGSIRLDGKIFPAPKTFFGYFEMVIGGATVDPFLQFAHARHQRNQ
jgi:hypothetical protein